jgi:hypothetical protein
MELSPFKFNFQRKPIILLTVVGLVIGLVCIFFAKHVLSLICV